MILTLLGAIFLAVGLIVLVAGSRMDMLGYVMACSLFNGSASVVLSALGNTSVQPAIVATGLLLVRCILPERRKVNLLATSLGANGWLVLFVGYGIVSAYTLPFLLQGDLAVVPLRPTASPTGLETHPLRFTPQNVTTSAYLLTTLMAAVCAHIAASAAGATMRIARLASTITLAHAAIGWFALATRGTPLAALVQFVRNGIYMQLDQSFEGFARISGVSPEAALYTAYGFAWLVFVAELWLRNVDRRWSGPAMLAMFVTLVASTSSTAYVGLAAYGLLIAIRVVYFSGAVPARKALALGAFALAFAAAGLALAIADADFARAAARMLRLTTTDKLASASGIARAFWARQGLDAFVVSWGLGIGVGSFRSSSIVTAIIGSGGVIATVSFVLYLARVFRPLERATWIATGEPMVDVAKAASWATLMMLVPAAVSAPSPDPGLLWGLIAGSSLGLRRAATLARSARPRRQAIGSISTQSAQAQHGAGRYQDSAALTLGTSRG